MGRPKKTETNEAVNPEVDEAPIEQTNPEAETSDESPEQSVEEIKPQAELPANVVELMRLYPQYEEIWITARGFVHPIGAPKYLLKDAKRYKNIFYKK